MIPEASKRFGIARCLWFAGHPREMHLAIRFLISFLAISLAPNFSLAKVEMTESQVKALFIANFIPYTEWPASNAPGTASPLVIGLFAKDPFSGFLEKAIASKKFNQPVEVRVVSSAEDLPECHILYFEGKLTPDVTQALEALQKQPVLTIGENPKFLEGGGLINFVLRGQKVRLQVNLQACEQSGIGISSRLLRVSEVIKN